MFTNNTAVLRFWYEGDGSPLMICMEEEGFLWRKLENDPK